MENEHSARRGLTRGLAALLLVALVLLVLFLGGEVVRGFLRWFDFLAGAPGLSGLLLLFVITAGFLGVLCLTQWVVDGFRGRSPDR